MWEFSLWFRRASAADAKKIWKRKKYIKLKLAIVNRNHSWAGPVRTRCSYIYTRIILSYYYCKITIIIPIIIHACAIVCIFYKSIYLPLRVTDERERLETKQLDSILLRRLYIIIILNLSAIAVALVGFDDLTLIVPKYKGFSYA